MLGIQIIPRLVGLTLLVAAVAKAYTPIETFQSLSAVLPRFGLQGASKAAVVTLIGVEVMVGCLLLLRPSAVLCWAACALLACFAAYSLLLIVMRVEAGCGCGVAIHIPGIDDRWFSAVRAVVMAGAVCPLFSQIFSKRAKAQE